jgi:hypothetical protein
MKVTKLPEGYFYKMQLKKISETILIIDDCFEYELLKIIADPEKYFKLNTPLKKIVFPTIEYFTFNKAKKIISLAKMKAYYKAVNKADPYYFSIQAETVLNELFKLKPTIKTLSARGWHKEHNNYNKTEKHERTPAKRKTPARNIVKAKKSII